MCWFWLLLWACGVYSISRLWVLALWVSGVGGSGGFRWFWWFWLVGVLGIAGCL